MPLLRLLGAPRLQVGDDVVALPVKQSLLLGSYLAYKEDWASRDELLHLFWPDETEKTARHNLSQLLYHCKQQSWLNGLEVERTRVRWLIDSDVGRFREALGEGLWDEAAEAYGGSLLEGITLETSLTFEDWLAQARENLQSAWREAVLNHADALSKQGQPGAAAQLLREVLTRETLAEDVLQAYMRASLVEGKRAQGLKAYEQFVKHLRQELGIDPLEATQDLAAELGRGEAGSLRKAPTTQAREASLHGFPGFLTPFVGRALELAELNRLLSGTRLLTLVGLGGMGKSRLAAAFAREQAPLFQDGAAFVELAALSEASLVPVAVLKTLGLDISGQENPLEQLLDFVEHKEMLFVFDNFEHLLAGSPLVIELLEASADSKVVVTSREALDFHAEAVYDLGGLSFPVDPSETPEAYDAVSLFLHTARRANPTFHLGTANRNTIVELCRLLDGSPLGLELAASWMRLLQVGDIVEALKHTLDALAVEHSDIPERHRSLRAIFEQSWALLSDAEQGALARLAVFRGGFTKDSAAAVADANLRTLLSLTNKSLLRRTEGGRFERHVMVREFSLEKLRSDAELYSLTRARHADYFADLCGRLGSTVGGSEQFEGLDRLSTEHANLRAAFEHYLDQNRGEDALRLYASLNVFWRSRGHLTEGRALFERIAALEGAKAPSTSRCEALQGAGLLALYQADYERARALQMEGLDLAEQLGDKRLLANALTNLGTLDWSQGNFAAATGTYERCLSVLHEEGDRARMTGIYNNLANLVRDEGDYERALELFGKALGLAREFGQTFEVGRILLNRGNVYASQNDYATAATSWEKSLATFRELGDKRGVCLTLNNLGNAANAAKHHGRAYALYQESLALSRELGDESAVAHNLHNIGTYWQNIGRVARAYACFCEALTLRHQLGETYTTALLLQGFTSLAVLEGHFERAARLMGSIDAICTSIGATLSGEARGELERDFAKLERHLGAEKTQQLLNEGKGFSLDTAVRFALAHPTPRDKVAATSAGTATAH